MGAVKQFYFDCAEAGRCPVSRETLDYLDDLECERQLDWIAAVAEMPEARASLRGR